MERSETETAYIITRQLVTDISPIAGPVRYNDKNIRENYLLSSPILDQYCPVSELSRVYRNTLKKINGYSLPFEDFI